MQIKTEKANSKDYPFFILGSGSPRRKELLSEIIIDFQVIPSKAEEIQSHPGGPLALVGENARLKAWEVARRYPQSWVLGADTMVWIGKKILGKPKDKQDAFDMLKLLSDKTHSVSTGVALICKSEGFEKSLVETSQVTFKLLSDETIKLYFQMVDPLDKAGAYAIQTRSDLIIKSFDGSKSNVIGLPTEALYDFLPSSIKPILRWH